MLNDHRVMVGTATQQYLPGRHSTYERDRPQEKRRILPDMHGVDEQYRVVTRRNGTRTIDRKNMALVNGDDQSEGDVRARSVNLPIPKVLVIYTGGTIGMKIEGNVYTPKSDYMEKALRKLIILNDPAVEKEMEIYDTNHDFLYLPGPLNNSPVAYHIVEYDPLLDSSCMSLDEYKLIVKNIQQEYEHYNGFVILHGTDTMAYTASYMSFMLENLDKPVVLTGSQIPIFETRSDGRDNLTGALIMAGLYPIPEVTILFNNKLLRGNRTSKTNCQGLDAFVSPNFPSLADLDYSIQVRWDIILPRQHQGHLSVFTDLNANIGLVRIFPGFKTEMLRMYCKPPLEAIILQTYGMGNVPIDNKDFMDCLVEICKAGIIVLNCTQCQKGSVNSIYEAGAALPDIGVISGRDMTIECAVGKLSYVLGQKQWSLNQKKQALEKSLRGEICDPDEVVSQLCSIPMETVSCIEAVRADSVELLRSALSAGRDPSAKDRSNFNALYYAVVGKHRDLIEELRKHNTTLGLSSTNVGIMVCKAAAENDVEMLRCLRLAGATLRERDYVGNTGMHVAVLKSNKDALQYLLDCDKSMSKVKNAYGVTPYQMAKSLNGMEGKAILRMVKKE